jgi:hypothetical protein
MSRRVAGAQLAAVPVTADSTAASALDWRRERVEGRIGKLDKQVSKLGECVAVEAERLTPRERARLRLKISRLADRLHEAAERYLDEIAGRL